MTLSRWFTCALAGMAAVALSHPVAAQDANKAGAPIKVGVLNSLTGPVAGYGLPQVDGVKLFFEALNASGGINGRPVELVIRDDQSSPQVAVTQLQGLMNDPSTVAVLGPASSNSVNALKPITHREKISLIMYASAAQLAVGPEADYLYRTQHSDRVLIDALVGTVKNRLSGATLGVMYSEDAYGANGIETVKTAAESMGLKIVSVESFQTTETDMAVQAARMKSAEPDAIIVMATVPGAAYVIRALGQVGASMPVLGPQLMVDARIPQLAGEAAEGVMFAAQIAPDDPAPGAQLELAEKWRASYGKEMTAPGIPGYSSAMVLSEALSVLVSGGKDVTRETVHEALNAVDVETPGGRMAYTAEDHDGPKADSAIIGTIRDGKFVRWSEDKKQ